MAAYQQYISDKRHLAFQPWRTISGAAGVAYIRQQRKTRLAATKNMARSSIINIENY